VVLGDTPSLTEHPASQAWPNHGAVQQEHCVMKFQRDPSRARMIELVTGSSEVAIDEASCTEMGVDADERRLVETVRRELAGLIGSGHHSETGEGAHALDAVAQRIGGALRSLNSGGLYLYAQQRHGGPIRAIATQGGGPGTHTVVIRAIRAQQAAA
jgi:hypothetical protein